jgi:hypothetical protein
MMMPVFNIRIRVWRLWTLKLAMLLMQRQEDHSIKHFDLTIGGVQHLFIYWIA